MTSHERRRKPQEVTLDLGLGGLFKGLGAFVDLVSGMLETGEQEVRREGTLRVKGLGDQGRGVYGFTVRMGIGGLPRVEPFGNIRSTDRGAVVTDVREPLVDVFDEGEAILVVAELPGVTEEEIRLDLHDDILSLETTGERKYAKEVLLPSPVHPEPSHRAYTNGILELRLRKTP